MYYTIYIVFHGLELNWIVLCCSMLQCTRLWHTVCTREYGTIFSYSVPHMLTEAYTR